jgi:Dolichyl-phosphate-mannose-protein mannosyltransferase
MPVRTRTIEPSRGHPARTPVDRQYPRADSLLERTAWAFVMLGVLLRLTRYAIHYPLWWDEAFLAVNLLKRDYLDLLRPLDYSQVCPILFLWAELAVVKLLGFNELTLRLLPVLCSVASVVLFRHLAGRIVRGVPLVLAVAIFAVSYHPIRYAAEVKPYASDLLAALLLLVFAIEWSRDRPRARWLWVLAATAPIMLAFSHPAIFVAGGIALAVAPSVARTRQRNITVAYCAFAASVLGTFMILYAAFTSSQAGATLGVMRAQWVAAFPPLDDPRSLIRWLAAVHTGSMFAYPCGGERGASGLSFVLFVIGAAALWCRRRRTVLLTCLAPFALALAAAAIRRYPYGGVADGSPARVMQYLVPSICLLIGIGAAALIELAARLRPRWRLVGVSLIALALIGILPLTADSFHPFRTIHAHRAREFARAFWPELASEGELVCLRWDAGVAEWDSTNLNVAVYLCNQMIYSPHRKQSQPERPTASRDRPLCCVLPLADPDEPRVARWLAGMQESHRMRRRREITVDMTVAPARRRTERYFVYEFEPIQLGLNDRGGKDVH